MITGGALILLGLVVIGVARTPDVGNAGAAISGVGGIILVMALLRAAAGLLS